MRCDCKHASDKTIRFILSRDFTLFTEYFPHFLYVLPVSAFEPDFVFPLENVTVAQGRDAVFTCVVNNLGGW